MTGMLSTDLVVLTKSMVGFAWGWMAFGIFTGLIIGMWSFDGPMPTPKIIGDYDSCGRRLIRLGHVAFIMLPLISMSYAMQISETSLSPENRILAVRLMWFGMIGVPVTCMAGGFVRPLKYLMSFPAISVFIALTMMACGKN